MKSIRLWIGSKNLPVMPLQFVILALCTACRGGIAEMGSQPGTPIALTTPEGEQLLVESKARKDYWPLIVQFVTQDNLAYCGVASSVMVLNAMSITAPAAPEFGKFRMFTQKNFFSDAARKVVPSETVSRQGMTLDQLGQLLETYPVKAKVYHAENSSLEEFRSLAVKNLQEPGNFVMVNYLRSAIGQKTGGHISPVAAYNEQTDRFLILDVSRYKYPPVWVRVADLWKAMDTVDSGSGKKRGFVLVSRP